MNKVRGMHWARWRELADLYHGELLEIKGKVKVDKYPVIISYDFHWVTKELDTLNPALICKLIEDGMVKANVLVDDCPKYVYESRIRSHKSKEFEHDTVLITICSLK